MNSPDSWISCVWENLKGNEVEESVAKYKSVLMNCKKVFKLKLETAVFVDIIEKVMKEIQEFDKYVPLAVNLRVEGMMTRHWEALTEEIKKKWDLPGSPPDLISPSLPGFTFQTCIDMQLEHFLEISDDISNRATKEFNIQQDLVKMYNDWKPVVFDFVLMKNSQDASINRNFEECINLNDEHNGLTTNLS